MCVCVCVCVCVYICVFLCMQCVECVCVRGGGRKVGGDDVRGLANSRRGRFGEWTVRGHREEVVESTISLPLHTVGTKWALTEAVKTRK